MDRFDHDEFYKAVVEARRCAKEYYKRGQDASDKREWLIRSKAAEKIVDAMIKARRQSNNTLEMDLGPTT